LELSEEEIKALLNYPWDQDFSTLEPLAFWKEVIRYLPPALALELKQRLNSTLGAETDNLTILHLDFATIVKKSSRPFLQRLLTRIGERYIAIASTSLSPDLKERVLENVTRKSATWIQQFLIENPGFSDAEVAEAKSKILSPLEWIIQSRLAKQEPGQNGV